MIPESFFFLHKTSTKLRVLVLTSINRNWFSTIIIGVTLFEHAILQITPYISTDQFGNSISTNVGTISYLSDVWIITQTNIIKFHTMFTLRISLNITDDSFPKLILLKRMLVILFFILLPIVLSHLL